MLLRVLGLLSNNLNPNYIRKCSTTILGVGQTAIHHMFDVIIFYLMFKSKKNTLFGADIAPSANP